MHPYVRSSNISNIMITIIIKNYYSRIFFKTVLGNIQIFARPETCTNSCINTHVQQNR